MPSSVEAIAPPELPRTAEFVSPSKLGARYRINQVRFLFVCLAILPFFSANAADKAGGFVVKGVGAQACSEFVDAARQGTRELSQYLGFVNGYTSAYNEITQDTFDVWRWQTTDTVLLLLLQRCQRQPELNFGAAVATLTRYFDDNKIEANTPVVRLGTPERGFFVYEPVYADIIAALEREGYQTSDPYAALMQYKKDNKLTDTKNLHQMLLLRLLSGRKQ